MSTYALLGVTVLIAAFVQGSTGLGFALISGPIVGIVSRRACSRSSCWSR